jgi:hypothetical protein
MHNIAFSLHLLLVVASWSLPFLVDWRLAWAAYAVVLLQFWIFDRCLLNKRHGLDDTHSDETFYSHLLEKMGFRFSRPKVKRFVRFWLLLGLAALAWVWQHRPFSHFFPH